MVTQQVKFTFFYEPRIIIIIIIIIFTNAGSLCLSRVRRNKIIRPCTNEVDKHCTKCTYIYTITQKGYVCVSGMLLVRFEISAFKNICVLS